MLSFCCRTAVLVLKQNWDFCSSGITLPEVPLSHADKLCVNSDWNQTSAGIQKITPNHIYLSRMADLTNFFFIFMQGHDQHLAMGPFKPMPSTWCCANKPWNLLWSGLSQYAAMVPGELLNTPKHSRHEKLLQKVTSSYEDSFSCSKVQTLYSHRQRKQTKPVNEALRWTSLQAKVRVGFLPQIHKHKWKIKDKFSVQFFLVLWLLSAWDRSYKKKYRDK